MQNFRFRKALLIAKKRKLSNLIGGHLILNSLFEYAGVSIQLYESKNWAGNTKFR